MTVSVKMRQNKYNHTNTMIKWAIVKRFFFSSFGVCVCVSYCDQIRCTNNAVQLYKKRTPDNCVK